ncbi:hypothetical protein [Luteibacter sp. CQ10]|uniref:hypothetical protein n=1 Tax=Luteibacter sp. CQ10 TaxID=2805821 RepID=UPI0034A2619C
MPWQIPAGFQSAMRMVEGCFESCRVSAKGRRGDVPIAISGMGWPSGMTTLPPCLRLDEREGDRGVNSVNDLA